MNHAVDPTSPSRDDRVLQHQGLVRHVAESVWHMIGQAVSLEDLIGYGQIGLLEAVDRFQPDAQYQFSTYAYYRIRGAILDGLCKMHGLSRRFMERLRFYRGLHETLAAHYEAGDPSMEDLEQVWRALDESLHDGLVLSMLVHATVIAEESAPLDSEGEAVALAEEWRHQVQQALNQLEGVDRQLIKLMYFRDMTLSEAAEQVGISRSWACRVHRRAIQTLRLRLRRKANPPLSERVIR